MVKSRAGQIEGFAPPSPFFKNVLCVRETEILAEQQPPQGVSVCDHAGLAINKLSSWLVGSSEAWGPSGTVQYEITQATTDPEAKQIVLMVLSLNPKP